MCSAGLRKWPYALNIMNNLRFCEIRDESWLNLGCGIDSVQPVWDDTEGRLETERLGDTGCQAQQRQAPAPKGEIYLWLLRSLVRFAPAT